MPDTRDPAAAILQTLQVMRRLRDPQTGCPWDLEQDFHSIAPYTIEEAYEVADAIQREHLDDLRDELGDLLFQVVFHARMAEEQGAFDFAAVACGLNDKMQRRHPHVFPPTDEAHTSRHVPASADDQTEAWEALKQQERQARGAESLLDGVPRGMAELQRAVKLQKRAARVGFDWGSPAPVLDKFDEELEEMRQAMAGGNADDMEDELGDLLFVACNLGRQLRIDPARALRRANAKFEKRFRHMEEIAEGLEAMTLEEMETLWQQVKTEQRSMVTDKSGTDDRPAPVQSQAAGVGE